MCAFWTLFQQWLRRLDPAAGKSADACSGCGACHCSSPAGEDNERLWNDEEADVIKAKEYDNSEIGQQRQNPQSGNGRLNEVMCWKDPNKICKCDRPQLGVFCGRYPIPTD